MDGITDRVRGQGVVILCFSEVQVIDMTFDIGLHVGAGRYLDKVHVLVWYK